MTIGDNRMIKDLERFLEEDLGAGDITSALIPEGTEAVGNVIAQNAGVLAGVEEAKNMFEHLDLSVSAMKKDGEYIQPDDIVLTVDGDARNILSGERVALNILGRMSGIATLTHEFVERAKGRCMVAGTRKTTPGFRTYEKKAIRLGGGDPHRLDLGSAVMLKDNHLALMEMEDAIKAARGNTDPTDKIEVEVDTCEDAIKAAELSADIIMLDNMLPENIQKCIQLLHDAGLRDRAILEASGGINPNNFESYASTGVDVISLGCLTHSANWLDFSMEITRKA